MIKTTKDGRTIRTGNHYTQFRKAIWVDQCGCCADCGRYVSFDPEYWHVHHEDGRGMGGSKRDDVSEKVRGLCMYCHKVEHGQ